MPRFLEKLNAFMARHQGAGEELMDKLADAAQTLAVARLEGDRDAIREARDAFREAKSDIREARQDYLETFREARDDARDAVREAREAVKEAREALREARDEGREAVLEARQAVREAKEELRDARSELREAREALRDARDDWRDGSIDQPEPPAEPPADPPVDQPLAIALLDLQIDDVITFDAAQPENGNTPQPQPMESAGDFLSLAIEPDLSLLPDQQDGDQVIDPPRPEPELILA